MSSRAHTSRTPRASRASRTPRASHASRFSHASRAPKALVIGTLVIAAAVALVAGLTAGPAAAKQKPQFHWDHYFDQDEVTDVLKTLHKAYPDLTELETIGKSAEGNDIWALTVTNERNGDDLGKPAIYVDGAIHGNEIQATEVCLYTAWQLLDKYGEWDRVTELVDRVVFYIIPTVNVDSRTRFFSDPGNYNIGRTARMPHDDDHDGLVDEDAPEDIDGDGMITQMRIADPFGRHRSDPEDARVMVRVKPGEQGEWTLLGTEGIDNDGDGRVNEDGPGYVDMNRSFGFTWQPRYVQSGSGNYPFEPLNTKAVSDFIAAHANIGFAIAWHNYGGMFLRGPGNKLSPPIPPRDLKVMDYLGLEGERTVPGYRYLVAMDDLYTTYGDFDEFMYQCWGVFAFTGEIYMGSQIAYRGRSDETPGPDGNLWSRRPSFKERHEFDDHLMMGEMFAAWQTYEHPTYGEIEIGGWKPFTVRMSPGFMLQETLHRNAMFVIWTATQLPEITVEVTEVKSLGGGLWRVRARAGNANALPTLSARALAKQIYRRDMFTIEGDQIEVLAGGELIDSHFDKVEQIEYHPQRIYTHVPAFGKREVQWIVAGKGKFAVVYEGFKCGRAEAEAQLK